MKLAQTAMELGELRMARSATRSSARRGSAEVAEAVRWLNRKKGEATLLSPVSRFDRRRFASPSLSEEDDDEPRRLRFFPSCAFSPS